jgi:hypothetical protein
MGALGLIVCLIARRHAMACDRVKILDRVARDPGGDLGLWHRAFAEALLGLRKGGQ